MRRGCCGIECGLSSAHSQRGASLIPICKWEGAKIGSSPSLTQPPTPALPLSPAAFDR